jgi:3-hydroxybutyryl-CoA dehydrogenase
MTSIKNILVCGAGMMGKNIALVFSSCKDFNITVYDINDVDLHGGIRTNCKQLLEKEIISEAEMTERLSRIAFTKELDCAAVQNADLVVECVFEDIKIKQDTFAALEVLCREDAIFCTNTSVISPSEISAKLKHRTRFVGTHFWNPGHLIPLVEVVKTDATSDETADTVMGILTAVGKRPVLCKKDVPGFIANRMQHALWREAISIVENGIADAKTVDDAVKYSFGLRLPQLAPMENADMAGVDLLFQIHSYVLPYLEDSHEPSPLVKQLYNEGKLGFKTGEGFQTWTPEQMTASKENLNEYLIKMIYGK